MSTGTNERGACRGAVHPDVVGAARSAAFRRLQAASSPSRPAGSGSPQILARSGLPRRSPQGEGGTLKRAKARAPLPTASGCTRPMASDGQERVAAADKNVGATSAISIGASRWRNAGFPAGLLSESLKDPRGRPVHTLVTWSCSCPCNLSPVQLERTQPTKPPRYESGEWSGR